MTQHTTCYMILKYWWVFFIGLMIRIITTLQTSRVDQYLPVKYTDVDYLVFSDASALLHQGYSPYDRATYRYSPLLAYLMLPNITLHEQFGKHLFSLCDVAVAILIYIVLLHFSNQTQNNNIYKSNDTTSVFFAEDHHQQEGQEKKEIQQDHQVLFYGYNITPQQALQYSCFYLFNPLSINLSTRGSMDVLHIVLLYFFLLFFYKKRYFFAAICYGLTVHLRIYPFLFALPILFTMYNNAVADNASLKDKKDATITSNDSKNITKNIKHQHTIFSLIWDIFKVSFTNSDIILFVSTVIILNLGLIALFYAKFGFKFLYETYLFHIIRKDTRHNFSPWFLFTYLLVDYQQILGIIGENQQVLFLTIAKWAKLLFVTIPHIVILLTLSLAPLLFNRGQRNGPLYCRDQYPLPIIMLLLSFYFVATNGVITAQYFLWFIAFIPLYLPYLFKPRVELLQQTKDTSYTLGSTNGGNMVKLLISCAVWFVSELLWLSTGFLIEVRGIGGNYTWFMMCCVSLWLFVVHMWLIITIFANVQNISIYPYLCTSWPFITYDIIYYNNINVDTMIKPHVDSIEVINIPEKVKKS